MNVHKNARLTRYRRGELVRRAQGGDPATRLARELGISGRTTRKWLARYRAEGPGQLGESRLQLRHCYLLTDGLGSHLGMTIVGHLWCWVNGTVRAMTDFAATPEIMIRDVPEGPRILARWKADPQIPRGHCPGSPTGSSSA